MEGNYIEMKIVVDGKEYAQQTDFVNKEEFGTVFHYAYQNMLKKRFPIIVADSK